MKRAQRSRLEDQRGTEINFELPDFLKDKENFTNVGNGNAATAVSSTSGAMMQSSKLSRKPCKRPDYVPSSPVEFPLEATTNGGSLQQINKPQPAPRLSIAGSRPTVAGDRDSIASPGGLVHSVSSENNLNNLSMRCNASLDENCIGSQSENSFTG